MKEAFQSTAEVMDSPSEFREGEMHITRIYSKRKKSDIVHVPLDFRREVLSPSERQDILDAPVTVFRILFMALNDASYDQFQPMKQPEQLKLFEEELQAKSNTYVKFSFAVTDIDENRDYKGIRNGLEFLENYNRGWHKTKNSKGKSVSAFGGLIISSSISAGKVSFLMSTYWIEKLLKIPKYNKALLEIPWKITKTRQILFYLWLLELRADGTKINANTFQEIYRYNYKNPAKLIDGFFRPMKNLLDRFGNVSFNFSRKGDLIHIVPYHTKAPDIDLSAKTISNLAITQKLSYWKRRHELEKEQVDTMKTVINLDVSSFEIMKKAYKKFISNCRIRKSKPTSLKKKKFMDIFQKQIMEEYQTTVWGEIKPNAYPRIV